MSDIYWGFALIGGLGLGIFFTTVWVSRKLPRYVSDPLALAVVVTIFAYIQFLWYNTRLVAFLPFSNLIILGNWFPLAAGALGGLAWQRIPGRIVRKSIFVGGLASTSAYSLVCPVLGDPPLCVNVWHQEICVQTTARTCTAACAATLLRAHGVFTTEREMATLCLTRRGTTWLGLYRGLKLKTEDTPWDVDVISCDGDQLLAESHGPIILSVGLPPSPRGAHEVAMNEGGWKHGVGHSVILLRPTPEGRVLIADPTPEVGLEEWTLGDVRTLYRGTAMRLVKRS